MASFLENVRGLFNKGFIASYTRGSSTTSSSPTTSSSDTPTPTSSPPCSTPERSPLRNAALALQEAGTDENNGFEEWAALAAESTYLNQVNYSHVLTAYNDRWDATPAHAELKLIPWPSLEMTASALKDRSILPEVIDKDISITLWPDKQVVEVNVFVIFARAFGFNPRIIPFHNARGRRINGWVLEVDSVGAPGNTQLHALAQQLRKEKLRWHPAVLASRRCMALYGHQEAKREWEGLRADGWVVYEAVVRMIGICEEVWEWQGWVC